VVHPFNVSLSKCCVYSHTVIKDSVYIITSNLPLSYQVKCMLTNVDFLLHNVLHLLITFSLSLSHA
jgi:hypothetical protein